MSLILSTNPIELISTKIYCVISTANPPTLHFIEITSTPPSTKQQEINAFPLCANFACISTCSNERTVPIYINNPISQLHVHFMFLEECISYA
jgi:hypothetical protein